MLQPTQSLYTHHFADPPTTGNSGDKKVVYGSDKIYSQQEVNDFLDKKTNGFSRGARANNEDNLIVDIQDKQNDRTLANLVRKSNRILKSISSHAFPFDIFPDTINVEEGRITIINRHFLSSEVHSIDIKDISNIFINTTIFFSQLVIISRTFEDNEIRLRNLRTSEAVYIRRIIEGLRIFENKQVDTSNYTKEELISKLEDLSTTEIVT
jgi:hypothetical protein